MQDSNKAIRAEMQAGFERSDEKFYQFTLDMQKFQGAMENSSKWTFRTVTGVAICIIGGGLMLFFEKFELSTVNASNAHSTTQIAPNAP